MLRVTESCMGYLILRARLRVHALRMHAHTCVHVCVRTFLDVFVPNLVETFLCMGYMICTCALACAHYARTMSMRVLHACARSHIFGRIISKLSGIFYGSQRVAMTTCVNCTHERVCTLLDVFAPNLVETFLCMGYMIFTCALACANYARTMRVCALYACARSHTFIRMLSKLGGTLYGSQRVAWAT
jgi:hypothetical protein